MYEATMASSCRQLFRTPIRHQSYLIKHQARRATPLSFTFDMRRDAHDIFAESLEAVSPRKLVEDALSLERNQALHLPNGKRIDIERNVFVVAFGKSAVPMSRGAENVLGDHIVKGIASSPLGLVDSLRRAGKEHLLPCASSRIHVYEGAANKRADATAEAAADHIRHLARILKRKHLLLALVSGGGSALLPLPIEGVTTVAEKETIHHELMARGAHAMERVVVRKQLSDLKGGGLARYAYPARVVSLMLNNMLGSCADLIAGGPTLPKYMTAHSALIILNKYGMIADRQVSDKVLRYLENEARRLDALRGDHVSTDELLDDEPQSALPYAKESKVFERCDNIIVGSNKQAIEAASRSAELRGYLTHVLGSSLVYNSMKLGKYFAKLTHYICKVFETKRTKYDTNVELSGLEFELIRDYGCTKSDLRHVNELIAKAHNAGTALCISAGGEVLVESGQSETGGKNQEVALSCAYELDRQRNLDEELYRRYEVLFLSADTDGCDGNSQFAGAVAYTELCEEAKQHGLDVGQFLTRLESNEFYSRFKDGAEGMCTGPTGSDVMNVMMLFVRGRQ